MASVKATALALLVAGANADVYMHNPPGNNDRNRERNDNRNNGNRLFDSQNNGNGGYPWRGNPKLNDMADPITYLSGSELEIKWTDQHGCGDNPSTHCTVVLQYACENTMPGLRDGYPTGGTQDQPDGGGYNPSYREGTFQNSNQNQDGTNTIPDSLTDAGCVAKEEGDFTKVGIFEDDNHGICDPCPLNYNGGLDLTDEEEELAEACEFGMNEDYFWYNVDCEGRQRNKGLYIADRDLNGNSAKHTRQNPNGNRRGFECPEERDYYPYWHPTQWIDMAVLVSDESWCPYYVDQSQNTNARYYCYIQGASSGNEAPIDEQSCSAAQGTWTKIDSFAEMFPEMDITEPDCMMASFTEQNHLGFTRDVADYSSYTWTIPQATADMECIVRIRYNISTGDYGSMDGFTLDSETGVMTDEVFSSMYNCPEETNDGDNNNADDADVAAQTVPGAVSTSSGCYGNLEAGEFPRYNRPYVEMFENDDTSDLAIALNTDQSGRTFQDRSFVFNIGPRPDGVSDDAKIYNLNVMGKRGNIVQAYPAIEYAFVPFTLEPDQYDYLHIQFHGSDFNNEKNPNNGEGWKFSDRSNMVEIVNENVQFPIHETNAEFFATNDWVEEMALLGQQAILESYGLDDGEGPYTCYKASDDEFDDSDEYQNDPKACNKLNSAPNTFQPGEMMGLMQVTANAGTYSFVSTRNNNFSNRSQKMSISVGAGMALSAGQVAGAVVGTVVGVAAAVVIAVVVLALFGIVKASWLPKQKFGQGAAGGKGVKASQQYDVSQSNNGTTRV
eukprot:CAMPEP_0195516648 /NCGR_PEP_ID=MMETSP0794_2-20130614/8168_1 /TAXON_ID=515487 /ORGANISM="Stephanopyxis turris, Strain CCMP 815" /LENGTH=782 /DNA_ID=CAMNT_0040645295 /DNA_START=61 /DNA_END=2409 /DNA_ORIENTATION=+